ncbi:MAG: hypothetical protein ACKO1J_16530 [Tagaea sp.]
MLAFLGVALLAGCASDGFVTRNVVGVARATADALDRVTGGNVPEERPPLEAPDPGAAPYPNLGAFPSVPPRGGADVRAGQVRTLEQQREAAREFDARLRAIDPALDPSARPPEPPAIAALAGAPASSPPAPVSAAPRMPAPPPVQAQPAPQASPQVVPQVALAPVAPATQLRAPVAPAPVVVPPSPPAVQPAPPAPVVAAAPRARANAAEIVGQIAFAEGTALLTPESKRDLRLAVIAANARNGSVRVTPVPTPALSPQDQSLTARRMAAIAIELEALGLDRARIAVEQGWLRAARVAVEY